MELKTWVARRKQALQSLPVLPFRDITPSVRDFTQAVSTQRRALSVTAEIARATPEEGTVRSAVDAAALARELEEGEVSAVAVATDPIVCGGSADELRAAASAISNPVIARDLVLSINQLYQARLMGADAVLLTATVLDPGELKRFVDTCLSMRMAAPVEVASEPEVSIASSCGARILVIPAFSDRQLSLDLAKRLLPKLPRSAVALVRGPFTSPEDLGAIRGLADGVWIAGPLMRSVNPIAFLQTFVQSAENG